MDIFVARQPVFDSNKKTIAYELLFRDSLNNYFPDIDGNTATSKVLSNTFFNIGIQEITNSMPGLINFTRELILNKIPMVFPKDNIIIEILEDIEPDEEIVHVTSQFKKKGYKIALDDFIFHDKFESLIKISNIIKFDLFETPLNSLDETIDKIRNSNPKIILLAEKVETYDEFHKAKEMGFSMFQGYFFSKPEILSNKDIPLNKLSLLQLVSECQKSDLDIEKLVSLIKNDPSVSYKLLKFINSAYFNRPCEIQSIRDAVTFMGSDELKKFINLVAVSGIAEEKPNELMRNSVIRARMCELMGNELKTEFSAEELFTIGLFSLMDAMLDKPMEEVLKNITFSQKFINVLLRKSKTVNILFLIIEAFEKGNWEKSRMIDKNNPSLYRKIHGFYLESLKMADSFI
ncbi:MAG: EAL and HDOD domain-containing protein [Thermodesulfobacteriota bacterium]